MRFSQTPPSLISLLLVALSQINTANAGPYPKDSLHDLLGLGWLQPRACASYCGADNQFCCTAGQACYTNAANIASCGAGGAVTGFAVYTTTWTETDLFTRTSTYSSYYQVATTTQPAPATTNTAAPAICAANSGETSCGPICCAADQVCAYAGSCIPRPPSYFSQTTYSPPLRPTSGGVSTQTSFASATTTQSFLPPATASGSTLPITSSGTSHGLSGGAIAGIVIGVIAGILLLLLLCFCCIVGTIFDGLLALLGLGKRKNRDRRTERVEVTERYSRHGSGTASHRDTHTGWFGGGGGRPARVAESRRNEKKSSGFGGMGYVGAGLLGLAAILGLKRREDRKAKSNAARSDISSSYYTDSYTGTSDSSQSSDRRTRQSRQSRVTRQSSRRG